MTSPGSTIVSLRNVGKRFERGTVALDNFNLDVVKPRRLGLNEQALSEVASGNPNRVEILE